MAEHIYHYNAHAEKRYFLGTEHHDLYDIISLNGNIVSHTPSGVAAFLATAGKSFYIDPQTHAFQHATIHLKRDISDEDSEEPEYEFKPSIIKLATERLKQPFSNVIAQDRPIRPTAFLDDNGKIRNEVVDSVCQNIGNFQLNTMLDVLDDEAREFIGESHNFQPKFIVAPYFYLSHRYWKEWLTVNIACYQRTRTLFPNLLTYLSMVVPRETLHNYADVISKISAVKPDGILLWIDEHTEEELTVSETKRYVDFLRNLRSVTDTIYNSHGGYLSILLSHSKVGFLDGVAHSMNYGEFRPIVPVGGGLPTARFYMQSVHSRLRYADAVGIVLPKGWLRSREIYREKICRCHQCQELLEEKKAAEKAFELYGRSKPVTFVRRDGAIVRLDYPTKEAKQAATRHYLYNKAKEFKDIREGDLNPLVANLRATYEEISSDVGEDSVGHLFRWYEALKDITNTET